VASATLFLPLEYPVILSTPHIWHCSLIKNGKAKSPQMEEIQSAPVYTHCKHDLGQRYCGSSLIPRLPPYFKIAEKFKFTLCESRILKMEQVGVPEDSCPWCPPSPTASHVWSANPNTALVLKVERHWGGI